MTRVCSRVLIALDTVLTCVEWPVAVNPIMTVDAFYIHLVGIGTPVAGIGVDFLTLQRDDQTRPDCFGFKGKAVGICRTGRRESDESRRHKNTDQQDRMHHKGLVFHLSFPLTVFSCC